MSASATNGYWVADDQGRVLGPLGLTTLVELVAAGRITQVSRVSRDGVTWLELAEVDEVASIFREPEPSLREREEAQKAVQLRRQLDLLRTKPAHEVLGVRATATLDESRTAFFALAKRFHPARLPPGTHPALRDACIETFQFLSLLMEGVERQQLAPKQAPRVLPRSAAIIPPPPPEAPTPGVAPTPPRRYDVEDFVGLSQGDELIEATVRVNALTATIFTEHHTVNFSNESVFLPSVHHLPLGTVLNVNLIFDNQKRIRARGRVVWENASENSKTKLGFGVRLLSLQKAERQFIRDFIEGMAQEAEEPDAR